MSNHENLCFFNKEGDYLNFNYNYSTDRFEGDILFDQNSSDTFKTVGLYMLEKVPSFEFESPGQLYLNKFQLFNEYGLDFYGAKYATQSITKIEPVNNDPTFYSKWIYGENFESKFPIGTIIRFNSIFLEFVNLNQTYDVVSTKKGAIMIISTVDNATFETTYYSIYNDPSSYTGKTISGVNAVGVYNYIDSLYLNNLSDWNEPDFYDKLYINKKLNIIQSGKNDGIVTVVNDNISDAVHFEYYTSGPSSNQDLIIEVVTKTDLPRIYEGLLTITSDNKIQFGSSIPEILKPGREFKIIGSLYNQNFLTVSDIPTFSGNTQQTFYATQSQVLWNNKIYQCVLAYTQSYTRSTNFIDPDDTTYWSPSYTYISVDQTTILEYISNGQIYLTTDKIYFPYSWTHSNTVTLASAAERYKDDLKIFNIDLFYNDNELQADLIYPSEYAEVNFYQTQVGSTFSIGNVLQTSERLIQVSEELNYELNYNLSENFNINIVFTDLDEYGLKITINKQVYDAEISWIYTGGIVDMERTIDRTLRSWLSRNYIELLSLGIITDLQYIGNYISPFYNAIVLKTEYPNVPMVINSVLVGSAASYHIEHSRVLFTNIGSYLSLNINNDTFGQSTVYLSGTYSQYPDIPSTLASWVEEHGAYLYEYGITVTNINNLLKFDITSDVLNRRLVYTINTSKSVLPGESDYIITNKLKGSDGMLIASNEVNIPSATYSFESAGFATGMVFSINNTFYPYDNQEYNIQFLDPEIINLSYQGPFWGTTSSICNSSAFMTLGFNYGFGQTACSIPGPTGTSGPFNLYEFNSAFSITYNPASYSVYNYNLSGYPGTTGLVDIMYLQLSNSIYAFGDSLTVMDSYLSDYLTTISLPGNTQSIQLEFNPVNNYLYCLSKNKIFVIDPLINSVITSMTFSSNAIDMEINPNNGDIYVTYDNSSDISIYNYTNSLSSTLSASSISGKMVFNDFEGDMYVISNSTDSVLRIDGSSRIISQTYSIPGATNSIFYEPVNESIYVYGSSNLWKIDNGSTSSITSISTSAFSDMIYNNITGEMNITESGGSKFKSLNLDTDLVTINSGISNYGYMVLNQFDNDVYISGLSLNKIIVINPANGTSMHIENLSAQTTKIIYNPDRKSVWAIQPSTNTVIELEVHVMSTITISSLTQSESGENLYGTLDPNYVPHPDIWLKSKDYVRRPRENFEGSTPVNFYWKWYSDNIPEFFMYDFTGDQLAITVTAGSFSYNGPKPLTNIALNKNPNRDLSKVSLPEYQQTVFDKVEYTLSYIDDSDDISTEPEPIQLFIGFKSENEGGLRSILQLWKKEEIEIEINSTSINNTILYFQTLDEFGPDKRGQITINTSSSEYFIGHGLKEGQHITIYVKDNTNTLNQYISNNNGIIVKIRNVFFKTLIVDFLNIDYDLLYTEYSVVSGYPGTASTTYCNTTIKVIDREIGRFMTYGQTEIEDIRFKIELGNVGKLVAPNEVFIFKEYDIQEGGIDWTYLNKKRKEMLMMKHLIYPYIGAYKSIINAINFFGYNDLQLNEYYRDINPNSGRFLKLFKVEIPDIFDNSVDGWSESDFIKNNFPNENFEETNLFNLTYFITDKDGNNILNYSLDEILIKLQGLKYWLKRNIIPLTHKISDITGESYFNTQNEIIHTSYGVEYFNVNENMTPITFKLNEAYLMPINSGSTVYNCVIDFYSIMENIGADKNPTGLTEPPIPYNGSDLNLPDYFNLKIRTYKTYKEWVPFTTYNLGDKITYYGKLYESQIDNNRVKNPRKYESSESWDIGASYSITSVVEYERDIFVCSGTSSSSTVPLLDTQNWLKITEWKEIDFEPVQTLTEYKRILSTQSITATQSLLEPVNPIPPFNFTIDSNIDPFITIEVTSDNGYGLSYRDKKNYEIRGLKDLTDSITYMDPIGPFEPITPVL